MFDLSGLRNRTIDLLAGSDVIMVNAHIIGVLDQSKQPNGYVTKCTFTGGGDTEELRNLRANATAFINSLAENQAR